MRCSAVSERCGVEGGAEGSTAEVQAVRSGGGGGERGRGGALRCGGGAEGEGSVAEGERSAAGLSASGAEGRRGGGFQAVSVFFFFFSFMIFDSSVIRL